MSGPGPASTVKRKRASPQADAVPIYRAGPPIDSEGALDLALAALAERDRAVIDHMLQVGGRPPLRLREAGYAGLAAIIVSQQVSTASADAIFRRLQAAIAPLTHEAVLVVDDQVLREAGLSAAKIRALRATAEAIATGALPLAALAAMPAEEAHRALVGVKGLGPWSADIFLLFCLGHPDAWPAGDLALQEAARIVLKLDQRPGTVELNRLGERWRPYRGVAARLLWSFYAAVKSGRNGMSLTSNSE